MDIRPITVTEFMERGEPLLREHWAEVERRRDVLRLQPNMPAYRNLEQMGALLSLGAYVDDTLVGYAVTIVTLHLHDANLIYASNDVLYVAPAHRDGMAGGRLMVETERRAKDRGARLIFWSVKPGTAMYEILKRHDGYAVHDVQFSKPL